MSPSRFVFIFFPSPKVCLFSSWISIEAPAVIFQVLCVAWWQLDYTLKIEIDVLLPVLCIFFSNIVARITSIRHGRTPTVSSPILSSLPKQFLCSTLYPNSFSLKVVRMEEHLQSLALYYHLRSHITF